MDAVRTYRELVSGPVGAKYRRRKFEPACSGIVLYLGLKKRYDHLLHHNFVFSRDPKEEFDAIYKRGEPAPDPTAYLARRRAASQPWRRRAAKRYTCSCIRHICGHATIGAPATSCPATGK